MLQKIFILLIKFIPIIQMVGINFNNTLYLLDIDNEYNIITNFIFGNSLLMFILICVSSYLFNFCLWHKLIIFNNLLDIIIVNIDKIFHIPITDISLYCILTFSYCVTLFVIAYNHYKCIKHERKINNIKEMFDRIN